MSVMSANVTAGIIARMREFDLFLLGMINRPFNPYVNMFFVFVVYSVYAYVFLLFFVLYKKKNWPELVHLFINTAAGFTIVTAVKYLTNVPRPELSPILLRMDPSFPSRHSFISGLSMHFSNKIFKGLLKAAALIYLVLIPLGSVYIGVHYPSDAVAGLLIGLLLPRIITQKRSVRIWNGVRRIVALLNNRIKL